MKTPPYDSRQSKRALVLIFDGIEEVEALTPVDLMRRAGIQVVMANVNNASTVEGRNGIRFQADEFLGDTDPDSFDMIVLPGGPGVLTLDESPAVIALIQDFDQQNKYIAAICAAPKILAKAGVLDNRSATSHSSVRNDLPISSDEKIVLSDHIITSQGAGTSIEFGLKLASLLTGKETAQSVSESIHAG